MIRGYFIESKDDGQTQSLVNNISFIDSDYITSHFEAELKKVCTSQGLSVSDIQDMSLAYKSGKL